MAKKAKTVKKSKKPAVKKKIVKKKKTVKKKGRKKKKKGGVNYFGLLIILAVIAGVIMFAKTKGSEPLKYIKAQKLAEFSQADKGGNLSTPRGLGISPDGHLYVADQNNSRVVKFRLNGEPVSSWGTEGEENGQFKEPSGVGVDRDNNVYVADAWNGRIQKFDSEGKFLKSLGGTAGGFYSPRNVAVNAYGMVFVADTGTSRIHRFDTEFNRIGKPFGQRGKAFGNFQEVFGLAFDSQRRLYVGDPGNRRVAVLTSDLQPVAHINVKGWEAAPPMWPMTAVDSRDYLYVVSSGTQEIWVYNTKDPKFKYVGTIKNDPQGKGLFNNPLGIAADSAGNIYVSETSKGSIVKIRPIFE